MDGERISGTWKIVRSTDPLIRGGVSARFTIAPDGLVVEVQGAAAYEIPWQFARVTVATNGQVVVDTGRGTFWAEAGPGADSAEFADIFSASKGSPPSASPHQQFPAGDGQVLVLYRGLDDGTEVDPAPLLADVAADAELRQREGWRLASMVGLPLRHGGLAFGLNGASIVTKAAIGCLYVKVASSGPDPDR